MMDDVEPPKPTGRVTGCWSSSLTGKLFAWDGYEPVFVRMPGSSYYYLPLFDKIEELEGILTTAGATWASVKKIEDGEEFLASIFGSNRTRPEGEVEVKVITNVSYLPNGRIRFVELKED